MKRAILSLSVSVLSTLASVHAHAGAAALADFEKTCVAHLTQKNKADICGCLVANYKIKNLTDAQVAVLTMLYNDKTDFPKDEQTNLLLDFDSSVAELCLDDPKTRIEADEKDEAIQSKTSEKAETSASKKTDPKAGKNGELPVPEKKSRKKSK